MGEALARRDAEQRWDRLKGVEGGLYIDVSDAMCEPIASPSEVYTYKQRITGACATIEPGRYRKSNWSTIWHP